MVSNRAKGFRTERRVEKFFIDRGYITYRVPGSTRFCKKVDLFGFFDILCMRREKNIFVCRKAWVQVKTNKRVPNVDDFIEFSKKHLGAEDDIFLFTWFEKKRIWEINKISFIGAMHNPIKVEEKDIPDYMDRYT